MRTRSLAPTCVLVALAFGSAACGSSEPAGKPIVIDGSSTVYPITQEAVADYHKKHAQQVIDVSVSSTGAGLKRFCAGELDLADASRHITAAEITACASAKIDFVELPVAYDAISVVVNRANSWATSITVAELKTLWEPAAEGRVKQWSQVRTGWPARDIHLVGPDSESGTFDYFNEVIIGAPKSSRKDYSANVDDNKLIAAVEADELALGYVGFTYFDREKAKVTALAVDDLDEQVGPGPVELNANNVRRGIYRPLSRPLLIYVRASSLDRPEVREFVEFYLRFASTIVGRAGGGLQLSPREGELAMERLTKRVTGTMFAVGDEGDVSLQMRLSKAK